jgi:hypothetical protein
MTREEYITLRKNEAWRKAKAALQEVWEWDGQRYSSSRVGVTPIYEKTQTYIDKFIKEMEDEGVVD